MKIQVKNGETVSADPLQMYSDSFTDMERMFDRGLYHGPQHAGQFDSRVPPANLQEKDKTYVIELAVPGISREDLSIEVEGDMLTVSSQQEKSVSEEKEHYYRREYNYSSFSRTFRLPETINPEEVKAKYENGVLQIRVPRTKELASPKNRIRIE